MMRRSLEARRGANKPSLHSPFRHAAPMVLAALTGLSGCSGHSGRVPVHPVAGRVSVQGEVPVGALVVFHPKDQPAAAEVPKPSAKVKPDGSFRLTTFEAEDGAPAGAYAVTVQWQPLVTKDGDVKAGPNVLPPDYEKPESSPVTVTVNQGNNELKPIEIARAKGASAKRASRQRGDE
jgi:hypothetical protein